MKMKTAFVALATAALLASCEKKETPVIAPTTSAPSAALSAVLGTAPTGEPKPIHLIRGTAKPGDEITVSGKIMGNAKPFVDGRSAFILGDPAVLTSCNEDPTDKCTTPWDTCCDSPEDKNAVSPPSRSWTPMAVCSRSPSKASAALSTWQTSP